MVCLCLRDESCVSYSAPVVRDARSLARRRQVRFIVYAGDDNGRKWIERTPQRWFTFTKTRETSTHVAAPIHSFTLALAFPPGQVFVRDSLSRTERSGEP